MAAAGFTVAGEEHAICPVMLWEEQTNQQMAREMLEEGVLVIPLSFPVVARGKARIRVQVIASHPFLLLLPLLLLLLFLFLLIFLLLHLTMWSSNKNSSWVITQRKSKNTICVF